MKVDYNNTVEDSENESSGGSPKKIRFEPHLIVAEETNKKDPLIRGVFRFDPKLDPACKPIEVEQEP